MNGLTVSHKVVAAAAFIMMRQSATYKSRNLAATSKVEDVKALFASTLEAIEDMPEDGLNRILADVDLAIGALKN